MPVFRSAPPAKMVDATGQGGGRSTDIGAIMPAYMMVGILYLFGGLLFGIATFRAKVLP